MKQDTRLKCEKFIERLNIHFPNREKGDIGTLISKVGDIDLDKIVINKNLRIQVRKLETKAKRSANSVSPIYFKGDKYFTLVGIANIILKMRGEELW